jgi:hypothetical protein
MRLPTLCAQVLFGEASVFLAQRTSLRLLIVHDDAEREFDYRAGAEQALAQARESGWTLVSVKNDWATVF